MLAIETHYSATNHHQARITARVMESKKPRKVTVNWDDGLDTQANHVAAAKALIERLGWTNEHGYGVWHGGACEQGYVFVCATKHGGICIY